MLYACVLLNSLDKLNRSELTRQYRTTFEYFRFLFQKTRKTWHLQHVLGRVEYQYHVWQFFIGSCALFFVNLTLILIVILYFAIGNAWVFLYILHSLLNGLTQTIQIIHLLAYELEIELLVRAITLLYFYFLMLVGP